MSFDFTELLNVDHDTQETKLIQAQIQLLRGHMENLSDPRLSTARELITSFYFSAFLTVCARELKDFSAENFRELLASLHQEHAKICEIMFIKADELMRMGHDSR